MPTEAGEESQWQRIAQPHVRALQAVAQAQDKIDHLAVISLGSTFGRFGETIQGLPALLLKALLLEESGTRAWDTLENLGRRFLLVKEPEPQTAIANFVSIFLVH